MSIGGGSANLQALPVLAPVAKHGASDPVDSLATGFDASACARRELSKVQLIHAKKSALSRGALKLLADFVHADR